MVFTLAVHAIDEGSVDTCAELDEPVVVLGHVVACIAGHFSYNSRFFYDDCFVLGTCHRRSKQCCACCSGEENVLFHFLLSCGFVKLIIVFCFFLDFGRCDELSLLSCCLRAALLISRPGF